MMMEPSSKSTPASTTSSCSSALPSWSDARAEWDSFQRVQEAFSSFSSRCTPPLTAAEGKAQPTFELLSSDDEKGCCHLFLYEQQAADLKEEDPQSSGWHSCGPVGALKAFAVGNGHSLLQLRPLNGDSVLEVSVRPAHEVNDRPLPLMMAEQVKLDSLLLLRSLHSDEATNSASPQALLLFTHPLDCCQLVDYLAFVQDNASALPVEEQDEEEGNREEEEEEEQERIDYDEKYTFTQAEYWECFHEETGEDYFEWYSAEELQRNSIIGVFQKQFLPALEASDSESFDKTFRVLDIGAGTSELFFNLYKSLGDLITSSTNPKHKDIKIELWGIDFSPKSIKFLQARKWERLPELDTQINSPSTPPDSWKRINIFYRIMDAFKVSSFFPLNYFHASTDKGCLDCFVNGQLGSDMISAYFEGIRQALGPLGRHLLITVTNADIPLLMQTGGTVLLKNQKPLATRSKQQQEGGHQSSSPDNENPNTTATTTSTEGQKSEQIIQPAKDNYGRFEVEEVRAKNERHIYICRPLTPSEHLDPHPQHQKVVCDVCERKYPLLNLPKRCPGCSNQLQRFLL